MSGKRDARGFTLVEILVALSILAIVMTILHGAFSVSAVTARVVDERADHLASLTGALDTLGHEVRGAYGWLPGPNTRITFTTMAPFHEDADPQVTTVSYEFSDGTLLRKVFRTSQALSPLRSFVLLTEVRDPSFSFFDGKQWLAEWRAPDKLPAGIRVTFSHKDRHVDTVIAVWRTR